MVFALGFGAGLSDSYQPDPWRFTGMQGLLIILEAPVAAFVWLSHRDASSGNPSIALTVGLAALWSLALGYMVSYLKGSRDV